MNCNLDVLCIPLALKQQHFLDDLSRGFPGSEYSFQSKNKVLSELSAYLEEVKMAEDSGNRQLADQLYENYLKERSGYFKTNYPN